MENSNFFERIKQLIEDQGIKSVNDFALNYLHYKSSEKINRLKNDDNSPSYQILQDISNRFETLDMRWLITGKGHMHKTVNNSTLNFENANINTAMSNVSGEKIKGGKMVVNETDAKYHNIEDLLRQVNDLTEKLEAANKVIVDKQKIIDLLESKQ